MSETFISIDLGTTRLKAAAFTPKGELLHQVATRHKDTADGQDANQWWRDTVAAIRALSVDDVAGISLSGRAGAGIFIDADGEVLVHPWSGNRHAAALEQLYAWRSGHFLANYGAALVAKYLWLRANEPTIARRTRRALYGKDFLLYRLTGAHVTDWSSGPDTAQWDDALCADFDLPRDLLPEPVVPWQIAGHLTQEAARQTGLPAGTLVAVGAHDGICANVGAGATRPGTYAITLGTHAVTRTVSLDPPAGAFRFYSLPPDRHIIGGNAILGGRSLDWLLDITQEGITRDGDRTEAYREVDALASAIEPGADGVRFLPFLAGQVAPERRPGASGAFTGLRSRHRRDALYRAVLEGAAFAIADIFEQIVGWCGPASRVRLTGGGAASTLMPDILAHVLDNPIEVSDEAVEGRGAAIFLAVALGLHSNYDDAADTMVPITRRIEPDAARVETYRTLHTHWRQVRDTTRPLDDHINDR